MRNNYQSMMYHIVNTLIDFKPLAGDWTALQITFDDTKAKARGIGLTESNLRERIEYFASMHSGKAGSKVAGILRQLD